MRRRELWLAAALVLSCCLWLTGFVRSPRAEKTEWEYMSLRAAEFEQMFKQNRAGAEGWELVAVVPNGPSEQTYFFKRPK